jgi:hypothetical protein
MFRQTTMLCRQLGLTGTVLFLSACASGTTTVELANGSTQALELVSVEFTGGSTSPRTIQSGTEATVRFNPDGESHIEIRYRSSAGSQLCFVDTYPEPGYHAEFHIVLQERACRVTREHIETTCWSVASPPNSSFKSSPLRSPA